LHQHALHQRRVHRRFHFFEGLSMRVVSNVINDALVVDDEIQINGVATNNIAVVAGGILHLCGICVKDIHVGAGGTAKLMGMVNGNVVNDGGILEVLGTVHGSVSTLRGQTTVSSHAVVVKGVVQAPGDNSQAVGLIGGAALGAAIAGPVGAIVGGVIGALLGKESKGLG
jgi:hypothetical protein